VTESTLLRVLLPVALFVIMLGVGLSLTGIDFKRVVDERRAFVAGVVCQLVVLPVLGVLVVLLFRLRPEFAVGLMVLAFAPGGATSNLITYFSHGDVALSVTLTAVIGFVTPLTIPLLTEVAMRTFLGSSELMHLPLGKTFSMLVVITVMPVVIGLAVNGMRPRLAARLGSVARAGGTVLLFAYILGFVLENWAELPRFLIDTSAAVLCLSASAMLAGYGVAKLTLLSRPQAVTVGIETGIQNGGIALLVTKGILDNATMSVVPVMYGILMLLPAVAFGWWSLRCGSRADA
jgi:BASS family bile acid:Na+ symporter